MGSIQTVEQATQVAVDFVRKYYIYAYPISARKETSQWIVDVDVSYFNPKYARIRIIPESGTTDDFKVTLGQLL